MRKLNLLWNFKGENTTIRRKNTGERVFPKSETSMGFKKFPETKDNDQNIKRSIGARSHFEKIANKSIWTIDEKPEIRLNQRAKSAYSRGSSAATPKPKPIKQRPIFNSNAFRLAYVVLDILREGETFGWNNILDPDEDEVVVKSPHIQMRRNSLMDRRNLILISTGCELMMINKNYFYKYADLTTMCKIQKIVLVSSFFESLKFEQLSFLINS